MDRLELLNSIEAKDISIEDILNNFFDQYMILFNLLDNPDSVRILFVTVVNNQILFRLQSDNIENIKQKVQSLNITQIFGNIYNLSITQINDNTIEILI